MQTPTPRMTSRLNVSTSVRFRPRRLSPTAVRRKCWSRRTATPIPMKTPQTKSPPANSLALSQGRPRLRQSTSATSHTVKPTRRRAHSTMRLRSTTSKSGHLRCRWARTVTRFSGARSASGTAVTLLDAADEGEDLDGVLAQLLRLRVLERGGEDAEALLVHLLHVLDPQLLERAHRRRVELEGLAAGHGE